MKGAGHCYVERRTVKDTNSLPWDLAHHIYMRASTGKIMIFANDPEVLLPLLQKKLAQLCRQAQMVRLTTDNAALVTELTRQIVLLQQLQPTTLLPIDCPGSRVFILRPDDFDDLIPYFSTLYVTCAVGDRTLERAAACMTIHSLFVRYV